MREGEDMAARLAIADVVHLYARAVRERRAEDAAALFLPDGVFEIREMDPADPASTRQRALLEGREAILAYVRAGTGGAMRVVPMIHNLLVTVEGALARANSLMETRSFPPGGGLMGEYDDALRLTGEGWRFARRVYTIWRGG